MLVEKGKNVLYYYLTMFKNLCLNIEKLTNKCKKGRTIWIGKIIRKSV